MCKKIKDVIGKVQSFFHKDSASRNYFRCFCLCGKEKMIQQSNLLSGRSTSCGCLRKSIPSLTFVETDIGRVPALTRSDLDKIDYREQYSISLKHPVYLVEPLFLEKNAKVVIKKSGLSGTTGRLLTHNQRFEVVHSDGTKSIAFSIKMYGKWSV